MADAPILGLIVPENFIQATRDSGYKNIGSALAELVDNAFEAGASEVSISIRKTSDATGNDAHVTIADNGSGMDAVTLRRALQFGWSSRFNRRNSHGRYGMGLPNASLSHARRVEIFSSPSARQVAVARLDVDEVLASTTKGIPPARTISLSEFRSISPFAHGTVVSWKHCDRLTERKLGPLINRLRSELGRLFRYQIWDGQTLVVNQQPVVPFDPLFLREGSSLVGAKSYGPEIVYEVEVPNSKPKRTSKIKVRFTELPIKEWHSLSNDDKNAYGIAKKAGVSIVRAGREIDRGWVFMGQKRKENYDDWWRCEVRFDPDLDELFGVTHTKQEIHPNDQLSSILAPDMERIARELNARARRAFADIKEDSCHRKSERMAERFDNLIDPPQLKNKGTVTIRPISRAKGSVGGLEYRLKPSELNSGDLYETELKGSRLTVLLNLAHPLVRSVFDSSCQKTNLGSEQTLELMVLAAARAELIVTTQRRTAKWMREFRQSWSNILATYLS